MVTGDEATKIYKLQPPEPEPFSTKVTSGYVIPLETHVRLDILNPLGGSVRTLVDSTIQAGFYTVDWDGKDDREREVAEGIYYFHFKVEGFEAIKKCTYLKGESQPEESE
jgi:flagellar hook assembly protein FlgD